MSFVISNAKYYDSRDDSFLARNIMVQKNKITGIGYMPDEDENNLTVINAEKSVVVPNVTDFIYVPNFEDINQVCADIQSAGVQQIVFLPNAATSALDSVDQINQFKSSLFDEFVDSVSFFASVTINNGCDELSTIDDLAQLGISGFYFDGIIENSDLLAQGVSAVDSLGLPIIFGPMTTLNRTKSHLNDGNISLN